MIGCRALVVGLSVAALTYTSVSRAQSMSWYQDSDLAGLSPGCASEIAVGPNNVPWALGCGVDNSGNHPISYLKYTAYTGQNCFGGTYSWQYTNGAAAHPRSSF
jgi:hypothetical protein